MQLTVLCPVQCVSHLAMEAIVVCLLLLAAGVAQSHREFESERL